MFGRLLRLLLVPLAIFYAYATWQTAPVVVCVDGWPSPSVGRPGACSHHGGVDYGPRDDAREHNSLSLIFVALAAIVAAYRPTRGRSARPATSERKVIEAAIRLHQRVSFDYIKPGEASATRRTVMPIRLVIYRRGTQFAGTRLVAFCYLRNAERTFALERMSRLEVHPVLH